MTVGFGSSLRARTAPSKAHFSILLPDMMRAAHALFLCCSIAQTCAGAGTRLRKGNSNGNAAAAAAAANEPDRTLAFSSELGTAPNPATLPQTIVGGTVVAPNEFPFYVQGNG
jgi:hypothetical protein